MISNTGRFVITFNGEIYNFLELRSILAEKGASFSGGSDTEVILAAFECWGIIESLKRFIGMFAFVVWDRQKQKVYLARDRIGEKPLYYGWIGDVFVFASELKALCAYSDWNGEINRDALCLYMRHNYIPAPFSIYKNINKLLPATLMEFQPSNRNQVFREYWSARDCIRTNHASTPPADEREYIEQFEHLMKQCLSQKLIADVPVGAFLSGGIDSSTVVSLMQSVSNNNVNTYTIGFHESSFNEAVTAKKTAQHLGTNHTELYVTPQEAMAVIPELPAIYDEPFADSSQIPTYLVSEMTRRYVTVALSGDGGDELFGGYNRYFYVRSLWNKFNMIPKPLRAVSRDIVRNISPGAWNRIYKCFTPFLPKSQRHRQPGNGIHKLADAWVTFDPDDLYFNLISHWKEPEYTVLNAREPVSRLNILMESAEDLDFTERMMFWDLLTYLPDDILTKVDRASMAVSLEARVPFLDHRIVEFAWSLPFDMKVRNNAGKYLLRKVLERYVPAKIFDGPKMGFAIPLAEWLRGPLSGWCEELLDDKVLEEDGFFYPPFIHKIWNEHKHRKKEWHYYLWNILMFQAWNRSIKNS